MMNTYLVNVDGVRAENLLRYHAIDELELLVLAARCQGARTGQLASPAAQRTEDTPR